MIMIQDDPMPTGADKPLRITGDPLKVQVGVLFQLHPILHIFNSELNVTLPSFTFVACSKNVQYV